MADLDTIKDRLFFNVSIKLVSSRMWINKTHGVSAVRIAVRLHSVPPSMVTPANIQS